MTVYLVRERASRRERCACDACLADWGAPRPPLDLSEKFPIDDPCDYCRLAAIPQPYTLKPHNGPS